MARLTNFIIFAVLSLVMMSAALSSDDHDQARQLMESGDIMPLESILDSLPQQVGRLLEVELEHEHGKIVYEMEILSPDGHVKEYVFDAKSGKLLNMEDED